MNFPPKKDDTTSDNMGRRLENNLIFMRIEYFFKEVDNFDIFIFSIVHYGE